MKTTETTAAITTEIRKWYGRPYGKLMHNGRLYIVECLLKAVGATHSTEVRIYPEGSQDKCIGRLESSKLTAKPISKKVVPVEIWEACERLAQAVEIEVIAWELVYA